MSDRVETRTRLAPLTLLAVTHGAPSAQNRSAIIALVDAIAAERPQLDVGISFVDAAHTDVAVALAQRMHAPGAVIVPLVLSAGFHVRTGLAQGLERIQGRGGTLADPLGPDPRIVDVLAMRLRAAGLAEGDAVVLAAAGSRDSRAVRECFETGRLLAARLGRPVTVGFIAAAIPRLPDAMEMVREVHPGARIVVGPYLLAPGNFNDAVHTAGADLVAEPLVALDEPVPGELVDLILARYDGARDED
ncbi:sirohydrochlorin chelatase [Agromyces seonyuensis]|uniref:Cobalamin biosynthesis protein CbiX n=1 Tax=Agromyces seonyuensis TaxID=2662446 RepID=A0A6I4NV10_9MICO|nr:CbiX/SirB N-terminal domain-containing protein [Agromyces seonyuensis]MWB98296.1 cobalamin biosynthesis protein CbiX [Agromyces seonyuensis]